MEQNDLVLTATQALPNEFGVFFYGQGAAHVTMGGGNLCVKPGGIGLLRISDPVLADSQGAVSLEVDFTQPPFDSGPGQIIPLTSWNLQYWYPRPHRPRQLQLLQRPGGHLLPLTHSSRTRSSKERTPTIAAL